MWWSSFGIGGKEAETLLDRAGMTLNKNTIPDDTRTPSDPSGIRFGTPALTTRGFTADACREVAQLMLEVLTKRDDETVARVRTRVTELAQAHPIP
jgi:glycine hydroxymethyltransferase